MATVAESPATTNETASSAAAARPASPSTSPAGQPSAARLRAARRRTRPLLIAVACGGTALWVPVEKLFMTGIGFDAASIGLMAAVYALAVPVLEFPSGVLADRWTRKGVLTVAFATALLATAVMGASPGIGWYLVGVALLGAYLALQSGTIDAALYEALVDELGDDAEFERELGRIRMTEGAALAASGLVGGLLAAVTEPRVTFVATLPMLVGALIAVARFREAPRRDHDEAPLSIVDQVSATVAVVARTRTLRPVVAASALAAVVVQLMLEFGSLWLIAAAAPTMLFGLQSAGITGALGVGGLLAGRRWSAGHGWRRVTAGSVVGASTVLVLTTAAPAVIVAQVVLMVVVTVVGLRVTAELHAAVPSALRAGAVSGVSTLTWLAFIPCSLLAGVVAERVGMAPIGLVVGLLAALALLAADKPRASGDAAGDRGSAATGGNLREVDDDNGGARIGAAGVDGRC